MKRFFAVVAVVFLLFVLVTPVFSFAATNPYSYVSYVSPSQFYENTYILNGVNEENIYAFTFYVSSNSPVDVAGSLFVSSSRAALWIQYSNGSPNTNVTAHVKLINLVSGYTYSTDRTLTLDSNGSGGHGVGNAYVSPVVPTYYYIYHSVDSLSSASTSNFILTDPFVYFQSTDASQVFYSSIPEPVADSRHFYIADYQFLYEIVLPLSDTTYYYPTINDLTESNSGYYITYNHNNNGLSFYIRHVDLSSSPTVFTAYIYRYFLSNGELVDHDSVTSSSQGNATITIQLSNNWFSYGLWFSSFIMDYADEPHSRLSVVWGETSFIHSDFLAVNALINSVINNTSSILSDTNSINTTSSSIDTRLAEVNTRLNGFASLCNEYFTWFKQTYYTFTYDSWIYQLDYLTRCYNVLTNIAGCLRIDMLPLVQDIRNTLVSHTETQPDTSAFEDSLSDYEEGESYVINQAEVALDDLESQMSGAADVLTVNSRGLLFVKNIFETFAFSGLNYYYILFVLVLGSVALLIGRRLR